MSCMHECLPSWGPLSGRHLIEGGTPCPGSAHAGEFGRGAHLPASDGPGGICRHSCAAFLFVQTVPAARRTQLLPAMQRGSQAPAALRSVVELSQKTSQTVPRPARARSERGRAAECLPGLKKRPLSPNTTSQGIPTCSQILPRLMLYRSRPRQCHRWNRLVRNVADT